ncbi:RING finger protein 32 [Cynoglossus semilaevis]|uniref:RING finger protein 32 n=1 Tax=Cynoglossus semilaevis TaxID=244447 RepID=UPI00049604E0|nr:RING finger protein 32 [Cynoglossus semilaevis]
MSTRKVLRSSSSTSLLTTSVAFQDHITRSLLGSLVTLSDPLWKCRRPAPRIPQAGGNVEERQDLGEEREFVLDPAPPPLTLAQKMGLVAGPAQQLMEEQWRRVKARSVQQGESAQPCPICREEFRLKPQVLLSCSHVFHKSCLRSFERISGRKCCPLCRREQYQTRLGQGGARLFRTPRIQACWRGHVARKSYRHVRKTVWPKDQGLRRKFFEARLQELNDSLVRHCPTDTETFLTDIDRSLSWSRRVFQQLERRNVGEPQDPDWTRIQNQVIHRGLRDCPICLMPLCSQDIPSCTAVLLSCSHLFHQLCLEAFESFTADRRPSCPLCRSVYHKRLV